MITVLQPMPTPRSANRHVVLVLKCEKQKKTTLFGFNFPRSLVIYWTAQRAQFCMYSHRLESLSNG